MHTYIMLIIIKIWTGSRKDQQMGNKKKKAYSNHNCFALSVLMDNLHIMFIQQDESLHYFHFYQWNKLSPDNRKKGQT